MSTEEIEVRVWAAILLTLAGILLVSVIAIIGGVLFVEQDKERISPIDQAFLAILKDVMLLCIGAVGGKLLDRVLPDPEAAAKAKQELAALEQNGELAKMANDTKLFELNVKNTDSARQMQIATRSPMPAMLSAITVVGFFGLLVGSALGYMSLTGSDVMMLLLGVLARETASVYNFWLGSSNSSQQKDLMKK